MALQRKIAYIDLSSKDIDIQPIPMEWRWRFLGGRGLNTYLLYKHLPPGCDPLDPDNIIVIGSGLLSGTLNTPLAYTDVTSKSPLTLLLGRAALSGFFASELRWAGFDHLVIKGRSPHPIYLFVHNGHIKIMNAETIRAKGVFESRQIIRNELGFENARIIGIGPAGENLVRFANVVADRNQRSGRTGMGAVLGSKNIKAIACRGSTDLAVKNPMAALVHQKKFMDAVFAGMTEFSAAEADANTKLAIGDINLSGSVHGFGDAFAADNRLVTDVGLDSLVATGMLQWAVGLYENDMIADKDQMDLKLGQANPKAAEKMIMQMALRRGLGDILAQGPLRAAGIIGADSLKLFRPPIRLIKMHTEDAFDGLSQLLSPTPFHGAQPGMRRAVSHDAHLSEEENVRPASMSAKSGAISAGCRKEFKGAAGKVRWQELYEMVLNCLGISVNPITCCHHHLKDLSPLKELLQIVSGIAMNEKKLRDIAYRCYALERLFNVREMSPGPKDRQPNYIFDFPAGMRMPLESWEDLDLKKLNRLVNAYYRSNGWTKREVLKRVIFQKLELSDLWPLAKKREINQ